MQLPPTVTPRAFERRFHLADHVVVTGAAHENGMLHIDLVKEVPEALKPRRIDIAGQASIARDVVDAKAVNCSIRPARCATRTGPFAFRPHTSWV